MKGFWFRLDPLRRVRDAELDAHRTALECARRRHAADCEAADAARNHVRAAELALVRTLSAGIDGEGLRVARAAQAALARAATRAREAVEASAEAERTARAALDAAWQRSRSLDTLRARAFALWKREQARREQREQDEGAARRRLRGGLPALAVATLLMASAAVRAQPLAPPPVANGGVADGTVAGELPEETLRRILGELRTREQALERRERDVAQRERVAEELEADARQLLAELDALRTEIDARIGGSDAEGDVRLGRLAKTYAEMPPAQAAPLLEDLDEDLTTAIVSRMKPKKSAAVLARMSPESARRISELSADPLIGAATVAGESTR